MRWTRLWMVCDLTARWENRCRGVWELARTSSHTHRRKTSKASYKLLKDAYLTGPISGQVRYLQTWWLSLNYLLKVEMRKIVKQKLHQRKEQLQMTTKLRTKMGRVRTVRRRVMVMRLAWSSKLPIRVCLKRRWLCSGRSAWRSCSRRRSKRKRKSGWIMRTRRLKSRSTSQITCLSSSLKRSQMNLVPSQPRGWMKLWNDEVQF